MLLLIVVYQFAIKHTTEAANTNAAFEEEIVSGKNASIEINQLKNNLLQYNSLLGTSDEEYSHEKILLTISEYCTKHQLIIDKFPEETISNYGDFQLASNIIEVRGSFKELTHLIYFLEKTSPVGKLISVTYKKSQDKKTKKTILTVRIYIQNNIS